MHGGFDHERTKKKKYLHEGKHVAEVEVVLFDDQSGWAPYLCMEDAYRLDEAKNTEGRLFCVAIVLIRLLY